MKSYYELLNIGVDADKKDIKRAFYRLAKRFHPDLSNDHAKFLPILNAYETLIDDAKRNAYDTLLGTTFTYTRPESVLPKTRVSFALSLQDIAVLRYYNGGKRRKNSGYVNPKGYDVSVSVTPAEIQKGSMILIDVPAHVVCPLCQGDHRSCTFCSDRGYILRPVPVPVRIPRFCEDGEIFTVEPRKIKKREYAFFRMKYLNVRIEIIDESKM